jgi:hypothetical protein
MENPKLGGDRQSSMSREWIVLPCLFIYDKFQYLFSAGEKENIPCLIIF